MLTSVTQFHSLVHTLEKLSLVSPGNTKVTAAIGDFEKGEATRLFIGDWRKKLLYLYNG